FVTAPDDGVVFTSSAGEWDDGVLTLNADRAREFSVTMTAVPNHAPVRYLSMNDVLFGKKLVPRPGVNGRAHPFDGQKGEYPTGVYVDDVRTSGTFALWVKAADVSPKKQALLAARGAEGGGLLSLGFHDAGKGFCVFQQTPERGARLRSSGRVTEGRWTHVALTIGPERMRLYIDGAASGEAVETPGPDLGNAEFYLGSENGQNFFKGLIDEVYLYDRVLSPGEIRKLFERDRPQQEAGE
ncbi:MAG: LamG domain-containing protein, partial [Planctomycetota bacterium]